MDSVGAAFLAAGTTYGAIEQIRGGREQAAIHEYNAAMMRQMAGTEEELTRLEVSRERTRAEKLKARQRALIAISGVELTGTPALTLTESAGELEKDIQIMQWAGRQRARRYKQQSELDKMYAEYAMGGGRRRAYATLLGGAYDIYSLGKKSGWY